MVVAVAGVGALELFLPAAQKAAAVVVAALDLMVVALVLVAQRFTRMAGHQVPAPPVPQALQPQEVLGAQEM